MVEHGVDIGDTKPIHLPPRSVPISQRETIEKEIKKMLEDDIVEPRSNPWASPILLVTKKGGSIRICIDYRQLNSVSRKDAYPLPRIDSSLEALAGNKWFCTIDLISGYWQCKMAPQNKDRSAFNSHMGLFEFKVLPYGMCNAPATFQRLIELVLRGFLWERCLCYIDDVIVFEKNTPKF